MAEEEADVVVANATVTALEMDAIFSGPSFFVNKSYLTLSGPFARLSFAEIGPSGTPLFRSSVTMAINDVIALRDVITMLEGKLQQIVIQNPEQPKNG